MRVELTHSSTGTVPVDLIMTLEDGGWTLVGIVEREIDKHFPLAVKEDGRTRLIGYLLDGAVKELSAAEIGSAIYEAVDTACSILWGYAWNAALAELFGLNRRTFQRDRVSRYLLPPKVLSTLAYISSAEDGEDLAKTLLAVAGYHRRLADPALVEDHVMNAVRIFYDLNSSDMKGADR